MKTGILSILGVILLILTLCLPASASESGTITITMTAAETTVSISLDKTEWALGQVTEDTEYKTDPEATWCTITNEGNVDVDLGIRGEHAGSDPLMWALSEDGTNDGVGSYPEYALWYHIAGDAQGSYTSVTLTQSSVKKGGEATTLEIADTEQFGLKLLTPDVFPSGHIGKAMPTQITISAVKA